MAVGNSDIARNVVFAMREAGARRLVMTSSRSLTATRPRLVLTLVWIIFRKAYADLARAEGVLETSGLEWTVVRAVMLTDKPYTGRVHIDFGADPTGARASSPGRTTP